MPRRDDHIDDIPSIIPERDDLRESYTPAAPAQKSGGGKGLAVFALLVALAAAGGAGYLFQQLQLTQQALAAADKRVTSLEDMLSASSETASESAAVQAVKIKELTSEVDKLWASAWRKNKARLNELEKQLKGQQSKLAALDKTSKSSAEALAALNRQLPQLQNLSSELKEVQSLSIAQKAQLSELDDTLAEARTGLSKLGKRVGETEDWVKSINAYRRQMNQKLADLEASLAQGASAAPL
jgi:chromosome segregation ATPase